MNNTVFFRQRSSDIFVRLSIFFIAIAFRSLVGVIFWGGCDLGIWHRINIQLVEQTPYFLPYFPCVEWFIWLGGIISLVWDIPVNITYKIFPILFDALLAVLIFDLAKKFFTEIKNPYFPALMYALSPISIFSVVLQSQWDSISVFFLLAAFCIRQFFSTSRGALFIFGVLFLLAFLVKPITVMFFPLFIMPYKGFFKELFPYWKALVLSALATMSFVGMLAICLKLKKTYGGPFLGILLVFVVIMLWGYLILKLLSSKNIHFVAHLKRQLWAFFGAFSGLSAYVVLITFLGFDFLSKAETILRHMNGGTSVFGLPFLGWVQDSCLGLLLKQRVLVLTILAPIFILYYRNRLSVFTSILLIYMVLLGFSGLMPHYFMWPLALLLLGGFFKIAAVYNLCTVAVSALYYLHPDASSALVRYQNAAGFMPLKQLSFLAPPSFFDDPLYLKIFFSLANGVLPLLCVFAAGYIFILNFKKKELVKNSLLIFSAWGKSVLCFYGIWIGLPLIIGMFFTCRYSSLVTAAGLQKLFDTHLLLFSCSEKMGRLAVDLGGAGMVNILSIVTVVAFSWSFFCFLMGAKFFSK